MLVVIFAVASAIAQTEATNAQLKQYIADLHSNVTAKRVTALKSLAELGPAARDEAGARVAQAMMDPDKSVRLAAQDALEKIDPVIAKECLTLLVDHSHQQPALAAIKASGPEQGKVAVPILLALMNKPDAVSPRSRKTPSSGPFRAEIVEVLALIASDDPKMASHFYQWMLSSDRRVQAAAISGMPHIQHIDNYGPVVMRLCQLLRTNDPNIRYLAARAIGDFGSHASSAEKTLRLATSDPDKRVREEATAALEKIKAN